MEKVVENTRYNGLPGLHIPFKLKGMSEAINRVVKAINNREKIVVYGCCDVDGITSTSLLILVLKYLNADVEYFIPDHVQDSHNLSFDAVKNHIKFLGTQLLITVGCGINSVEQVELCKQIGIDVIITDYHECREKVPDCIVVNPRQDSCKYPFKDLSGAGIVYKLCEAISMYYEMKCINKYLDLVMLGTISSDVPIVGENKIMVEEGICHLFSTNNYGIKALIKINKAVDINEATAYKLAFTVIPTINAVGRMDNAKIAVELFTTTDSDRAEQIAKYLNMEVRNKQIADFFRY
ncbi:MAG: DHH family phosphoesterase [Bacillota bacterium]|nr:DHH family phosphoesterase [Bacillota bacterium]